MPRDRPAARSPAASTSATELRPSAFDDDATGLVVELADIAALAIDDARHGDEVRRQAELDRLAARLAAPVAEREAELAAVRARLPASRDRLGPRPRRHRRRLAGGSSAASTW
ncbi:MAG: hypothetical protein HS111_36020 [Kofleriaceae bacterium]|nr:hypothetical protein [Kofleriaceae bacterium]